jgi:hypothetical protein
MSYPPAPEQPESYGPGRNPPGAYPPGAYPPGAYPPGADQPGANQAGQYPPGAFSGGQYGAGPSGDGPYPGGQQQPGSYQAGSYQAGPYQPGQVPPGQYPPPGPNPPPGYQLARPGRPGYLVSAILLGILAVAAIGIALALGHAATECSTDIGQLAQAFDQQAAGDCSAASTARTVLEIAAPLFAVGCIAMIIGYRRRR